MCIFKHNRVFAFITIIFFRPCFNLPTSSSKFQCVGLNPAVVAPVSKNFGHVADITTFGYELTNCNLCYNSIIKVIYTYIFEMLFSKSFI